MSFEKGNKSDQKHYWITPEDLMAEMQAEFEFDFDPCPYPKPLDFDGLGKKRGPTAWAKKAIQEYRKGKRVVLVYPIDKWIHMLLQEGAKVRNLGDIHWRATEDGSKGPGTGRWVAMFILDPSNLDEKDEADL